MPFLNRLGNATAKGFGFGAGSKPGAPTSVVGTSGNQQVSVAFTPPVALGTGTPTYTATSSPGSFTASGSSSPLVVTGLTNGTAYTFTVTASNGFGSSVSDPSSSVTPAGVPSTPSAPTASLPGTYGNTTASVSWTAPSANGSAITDYLIQYSSDSGSTWTTFADGTSTTTSATVTGLSNGTAYVFRIAAVNSIGTSSYSSASNSVTPLVGKVTTPTLATATSEVLSFTVVISNYDAAVTYSVSTTAGTVTRNTSTITVTGLGYNASATVSVYASRTNYATSDTATRTGNALASCSATGSYTSVEGGNCGTCGIICCASGVPAYNITWYTYTPYPCASGTTKITGDVGYVGGWYCLTSGTGSGLSCGSGTVCGGSNGC